MQMVKAESVTEIIVPRYNELSVERIWSLVQAAEDLNSYFPDYSSHQFPGRKFMYVIFGTFRSRLLENIIKEARKQRSISENQEANDFVHIKSTIFKEIKSVLSQKGKNIVMW